MQTIGLRSRSVGVFGTGLVSVALGTSACVTAVSASLGPEAPEPSCEDLPPEVTPAVPEGPLLGDGVLDTTSPVPVLEHPRGGWFVPVRVSARNLGSIVWVDVSLVAVGDASLLSERRVRVQLVDRGDCEGVLPWFEAFLDPTALDVEGAPVALDGTRAELLVAVTDPDGNAASGSIVLELDTTRLTHGSGDTGGPGKP